MALEFRYSDKNPSYPISFVAFRAMHTRIEVLLTGVEEAVGRTLAERAEAKANKDWTKSDFIRDKLKEIGVQVKDTKNGVEWSI